MIILISPSKALNFESKITVKKFTQPVFLKDAKILIEELRKLSKTEISQLMDLSKKLADLNFERYKTFQTPFNEKNSKPAIFVFDGDVYSEIHVEKYGEKQIEYAQENLRILSGLYGILKPLDLIQPYRLEMSVKLENRRGKNLYQFWQEKISDELNLEFSQKSQKIIVNLASEEYFGAVDKSKIKAKIINVIFKENKNGKYKIIGLFAKKARGMMADFMACENVKNISQIKKFDRGGYKFIEEFSDENNLVFCR